MDDMNRNWWMGAMWGVGVCFLLWLLCGCGTPKTITVEKTRIDTTYVDRLRVDSFWQRDSVWVETYTKGDTVYRTKTAWKWRDRVRLVADTVYKSAVRADTIRVPVPVERKATWWERHVEKPLACIAGLLLGCGLFLGLLWLIHRRRER